MESSLAALDLLIMREQGTPASQSTERFASRTQGGFMEHQIGLSDQDWNGLLGIWDPSAFFDGDLNGMNI
jgi:transcriptional regulatory protein AMDR